MILSIVLTSNLLLIVGAKLIPSNDEQNQLVEGLPIERKSWFDTQLLAASLYDNLGDIMVFDGGTWNPYPTYRGGGKPQNFKAVCQNKGEYLNLCGECVGGSSEKDDDYGLDSCGVCAGLERCGQTSCEDSIEDFELSENCTKIIGIRPKAIDMAVSSKGVIHLIGNINTNNLLCSVYSDATELGAVTISETQWGLQFEFDLPKKEGRLDMHCNSTEGVVLRNSLLVVDSRKLQPLSSREKSIEYGKESYVTLSVANMISMVDLVCFARDQDGSVLYKAWSHDIQGNSLSSTVICDRIWPKKAGKMKFGVAYSAEAITSAKTLDIEVVSKDLTLHWASASKDKLALIFDQVLETYNDCGTLFKTISDKDAKCWSAGNKIMVKFKGSPKVKIGDTLEVLAASASVGIPESFSVKINGEIVSEQLSNLEIKGPKVICRNQKVTFDVDGSGVKWSLALPNNSASDGTMTPGNKQRKNMMMWRNVRETAKMMKADGTDNRMSLNTSLLTPGAEYQIKATLPDRQGKAMTLTKNFKIATHNGGEPMIKGPMNPSWTNEALYELDNPLCGPKSDDLKYEWVIGTENEAMIQQTGSKIHLKPGVLSSNTKYNVTVRLMNSSQLVSEVALEVFAQPATLKAATYVDEIVYGTGHKILLLGNSEVLPTKSVGAKYRWSCESETGYCAMPGKELKSIETLGGFDNSVLVLPPGSLPVGSYLFTLNVSLTSGESTLKTTRVRIVPGEPTLLSLVSVDFGESLKIILQAKDIIGECEINLESLKSVNTSYLDLSEMVETDILKGTPSDPQSKTLKLDVPFEKLVYGTSYMFRLIGDCGALSQSWLVFTIPIPEKSASCVLNVTPMSGVALSTEFTFQVTDCYPNNPIYSFGYVQNDKVHYLSSTLDSQKKLFSFPGNLKPVMKICEPDKMCAVYFAENITVDTAPVDIEVARTVVVTMSDDLNSGHFEEVLGTTALLLESCKSEPDILNNVSDSILQIIVIKIQDVSAEIDQGGPVTSQTLDLLQCALGVVEAAKGSDEVITVILRFCDKIEEKAKTTGVDLPDQRPSKRNKRSFSVTKRETNQNIQKVESLLKAYSYGIQNFKDKIEAKAKSALLLEKIPGMAVDMCNTLSKNAKPVRVESPVAELSTIRIIIGPRESKVNLTLPECLDACSNSSLQIVMNEQVLEEMNHTDVCLGVNYIQDDYYSETRNATSELNITRLSGVYKSMVFKYDGDKAANLTFNRSKLSLATIRIPIRNTTIPKDTELKCHLWKNDFGWNFSPCETLKRTFISKVQALECRCPFPGVYAVFLIPESETKKVVPIVPPAKPEVTQIVTTLPTTTIATPPTTIPTTAVTTKIPTTLPTTAAPNATTTNKTAAVTPQEATKPVTTTQQTTTLTSSTPHPVTAASPSLSPENYRVAASFMIDENFNETVGVKKQEFENSIKTQLIKSVQIPDHAKVDALNSNAKIKVVINMRYAEKTDMSKLQQLLKSGDLKLHGLNNTELKVTEQDLELVLGQKDGRSSTFAVVSTAIFISLTFILAILLSGMFLKWKRQQRALSFVQNMEVSAPRYLRLHEESSVDNLERNYGSTDNLRSADLDSGIVLTVDPNRMSTKYHTGNSSSSGHPRA